MWTGYANYAEIVKQRVRRVAKRYNLSLDDAELLLTTTYCEGCGTDFPGPKGWQVDHCHKTGKVRCILCFRCNLAVGLLDDDPEIMESLGTLIRERTPSTPKLGELTPEELGE